VQTSRLQDGSRRVTHVSEVRGYSAEKGFEIVDIFARRFHGRDEEGNLISTFEPTGELPLCTDMVHSYGMAFPEAVYEAARVRAEQGPEAQSGYGQVGGHHG